MKATLFGLTLLVASLELGAQPIDLAGEWRFSLDPADLGIRSTANEWNFPDTIRLPGILTAQGFGEEPSIRTQWTGKGWEHRDLFPEWQTDENFKMPFFLTPPRHYIGPAWYQRDIEVPEEWRGKRLRLHLERVHFESSVWMDGEKIGRGDSLGTPHVFDLNPLDPRIHALTLRIDNRLDEVDPGGLAHSVTDHTQGNWNGVVGTIKLEPLASTRIDRLDAFPSNDGSLRLTIRGELHGRARLALTIGKSGDAAPHRFFESTLQSDGAFEHTIETKIPFKPDQWSEFSPDLYQLAATLGENPPHLTTIAFREIENCNGILTLNGRRAFMRGTLECAIFPRLGHPPTDVDSWKRIVRICKEHGLNHIRFHSWCPPKAAFIAADELGFYLQPEVSTWPNSEVRLGSGDPIDAWIDAETDRMIANYGNHPSFLLMACGNEPAGLRHAEWLARWVQRQQRKDPRRLYTTAAGWPILKGSDFHIPIDPRIQGWGAGLSSIINAKPPSTAFDWRGYVNKHRDAPVIAHEIGQWCAYPNYREIDKYDGYFKPKNFEIFRETARRHGILDQADEFLTASGKWQAAAYKHDIEAALRTPGFGGFQLLDLHDFPGQGTALVGVLDAFWDSKGYISAEEFHRFCGPVVPLARIDRMVLTTADTLRASLELAHFGPDDFPAFSPEWTLSRAGRPLANGRLEARPLAAGNVHPLGHIEYPLGNVQAPAKLTLTVAGRDTTIVNFWDIFVYPDEDSTTPDVLTTRTLEETLAALDRGEAVLWLADPAIIADDPEYPLEIGFSPIFWNTVFTNWQPPHTLGLLNRADHPALAAFPTDTHSNWQWWEIVSRSRPFIVTPHHGLKPIVQPIDDWVINRKLALIFEAKVGDGRLLACSADLVSDSPKRPAARQLLSSLRSYVGSSAFNPETRLEACDLRELIARPPRVVTLSASATASSEEEGYAAKLAIDGNPATFWHTPFSAEQVAPPHTLTLRFADGIEASGIALTPRGDGNLNGRPAEIAVLDSSGKEIVRGELYNSARRQVLRFPNTVRSTVFTLRILNTHTPPFVALGEVDLLP